MKAKLSNSIIWLAAMLLGMLPQSRAAAQVFDQAGFFGADAVAKAEQTIADIQRQSGKKVVVETFNTLPAGAQASDKFYESWIQERGKATRSDVHVILVKSPSHLEVGASSATRAHDFTPDDHHAVSSAMLTELRAKNYDRALLDGLNDIASRLRKNQSSPAAPAQPPMQQQRPTAAPTVPPAGTNAPRGGGSPVGLCGGGLHMGWICLAVGVLVILVLIRGIRRVVGGGGGGYARPGYGQPGYGQPGQPGPGGGGGFGRGMLGGLLGGVLGGAAYDHFSHRGDQAGAAPPPLDPNAGAGGMMPPPDDVSSGGDFGDASGFSSGGDFGGGGGDVGGGGGGDVSSGGDF